jgi:hypothetical protein
MNTATTTAASAEVDLAGRVARRHLHENRVHPDARLLDLGWLARHGYLDIDCYDGRIEVQVDLGGGHDMVTVIRLPAGFDWRKAGTVEITEDGMLVVEIEGGVDLRWDLSQLYWRPA